MRVRLPAAAALASVLRLPLDAAASVHPSVRWLGREVRCLPSHGGAWQVSLRVSGGFESLLSKLTSATGSADQMPMLSLARAQVPAVLAAPSVLALCPLPFDQLRRVPAAAAGAEDACFDAELELAAEEEEEGASAPPALLHLNMRLRRCEPANLEARDEAREVSFCVRVRLHSVALLAPLEPALEGGGVGGGGGGGGGEGGGEGGDGGGDEGGDGGGRVADDHVGSEETSDSRGAPCMVRLAFVGLPAQQSSARRLKVGKTVPLLDEELCFELPNPPFTPRAALEQLRLHPLKLELVGGGQLGGGSSLPPGKPHPLGASAVSSPPSTGVAHAGAPLALETICGGPLEPLPRTASSPEGQMAAATIPAELNIVLEGASARPMATLALSVTLQCVYQHSAAAENAAQCNAASSRPQQLVGLIALPRAFARAAYACRAATSTPLCVPFSSTSLV